MKLKYLGTAAAEGVPAVFCQCENCKKSRALGGKNIRTRSQAIVDNTLLIDFPQDTYMHYLVHDFPLYQVKSCLITHSHMDHLYVEDIQMRQDGFSHLEDKENPLVFYSDKSGYDMICDAISPMSEKEVMAKQIPLFTPFDVEGYSVTALRAAHADHTSPVVFIIEKDGKSLFYSHDTSMYPEKSIAYLKSLKSAFQLVSLDCTEACSHVTYVGHMSLERCIEVRDMLLREQAADENTIFVLNHFSHNGTNVVYDDFCKIAEAEGFIVSYDGMEIEL